MVSIRALLMLGVAAVSGSSAASAAYLYDTGPGTNLSSGITESGAGSPIGRDYFSAGQFTLTQAATVSSVEAFMFIAQAGTLQAKIYDAASGLPGTSAVLYSASAQAAAPAFNPIWFGANGLDWSLAAGTYWLSLEVPDGSAFWSGLNLAPASPALAYAGYDTGAPWFTYDGSNTFGFRVGGAAAVPEPATWAMIVGGFGLLGGTMRARRRVSVTFA